MTLANLKSLIAESDLKVLAKYQRIFFLGRELKTESRSLESLGFGKFNVRVMHLMSNQPKILEVAENKASRKRPAPIRAKKKATTTDSEDIVIVDDSPAVLSNNPSTSNDVIELLNDDEESENVSSGKKHRPLLIDLS